MKRIVRCSCLLLVAILLLTGISTKSYGEVGIVKLEKAVEETSEFIYKKVSDPQVGSVGGEWAIIGLARSGYDVPQSYYENYYSKVEKYVKSKKGILHEKKYTEYSRLIVALTAIGKDPQNVAGYNLLTPLGDYDKTIYQGINGPIWALISLDSGNYDIPVNSKAKTQGTRGMYINRILESQLPDGGWSLMGGSEYAKKDEDSDPDVTGMALQALAKYQDKPEVKKATDEALITLSKLQGEDGGYNSWGEKNLESNVQVLVALTELGINFEDERFVKNGNTLLDSLFKYYKEDNGFIHNLDGSSSDQISSEQGLYGIVAAKRFKNGNSSLYRINDSLNLEEKDFENKLVTGLPNKHLDVNTMPIIKSNITFNDISGQNPHKYQKSIEELASRGIITGKSEKEFDPNGNITRAEFATIVIRALGIETKGKEVFKDVKSSHWFYEYVSTANKYGIVNGISKDEFNPNGTLTKQEAVTMLARGGKLAGMDIEENNMFVAGVLSQFEDYVTIEDWAMASMAFAYHEEIIDSSNMKINPRDTVTRSEIAEMLFNMLNKANLL